MSILQQLKDNQLSAALGNVKNRVRDNPTDIEARSLLGQLYCFSAQWDRADKQLETIGQLQADMQIGVNLMRQLIRGEIARQQFFFEGRLPEVTEEPDEAMQALFRAVVFWSEGALDDVRSHVEHCHHRLASIAGTVNGTSFRGARDFDDLLSGFVEILTSNGKYYLIPFEKIRTLTFRRPERLQDQIWRSANMVMDDSMQAEIYLPTCYCKNPEQSDHLSDALKLGGETDWIPWFQDGPVRGVGQKMYLFGETEFSIMEIGSVVIQDTVQES